MIVGSSEAKRNASPGMVLWTIVVSSVVQVFGGVSLVVLVFGGTSSVVGGGGVVSGGGRIDAEFAKVTEIVW
jgi:hypothetical protein